ncbi:MAG TPA: AsmA family protein, partial [Xanthomonadales bacterium]|nr:AsmA family protein [Xanthomonadales bacterium]
MHMRRKILYTFLTVVILLMLGVGVVWHLLGDETFMKRQVASAVEKATGRQLTIAGKFDLSLGSETTLVAEQIQFANPGWSTKPDMVDVRQLTLSFDLWSLLNGPLLVHLVDVSGCQVNLEQNTKGQANWNFSKEGDEKPKLHEADKARSEFLVLQKVELDECVLIHQAPDREEPLKAEVGQLALNWLQTGKYEVYAKGKVDTYDMSLSGDMGPFRSFWEGGPFEQNVKLNVGDISLDSSGSFSDVKTGTGANVKVQFSGPEFARVTEFLALPPFSSDAFDFKLHLNTSGDTTVLVVDGDLGSFDITANGEVDKLVQPYTGNLDTTARGPDLRALGELFEIEGLVEESFEIELKLKLKQGQLDVTALALDTGKDRIEVTGDAGSWPRFHGASIKFDISTEDYGRWEPLLSRQPKTAGPLTASGQVDSSEAGAVSITAKLTQQGNELSLDGSLGNLPLPDQPDLNFNLSAQSFQALGTVFDKTAWPDAAFKAKGRVSRNELGLSLENVTASLADNEAELNGILALAEDFEGSEFELKLDIPSTTTFGELMGYDKLPDQPLRLSAHVK